MPSIPCSHWFCERNHRVVKPLLLDEGPILREEAEFLGHALINKFLMIVIMSWLFTCSVSFQAQFLLFARHRALDRDRD